MEEEMLKKQLLEMISKLIERNAELESDALHGRIIVTQVARENHKTYEEMQKLIEAL